LALVDGVKCRSKLAFHLIANKQLGAFFVNIGGCTSGSSLSLAGYGPPSEIQQRPLHDAYSRQDSCKPFEFPLYSEIFATLLACLIASWGGWLSGRGNRWGWSVGLAGIGLLFSVLTTIGFCDPLFWRPYWHLLNSQEANRCQCDQPADYRQTFQHYGENVSQIHVDVAHMQTIFSPHMAKPNFIEFLASAGRRGIGSVFLAAISFVVSAKEHADKQNIPTEFFAVLGLLAFCYGAYLAWTNEHNKYNEIKDLQTKADIRATFLRASIDTTSFGENGQRVPVPDGVCVSFLMTAVNHGHDVWFGKWPILEISFGGETYQGTSTRLPDNPWLLQYDDPILMDRHVQGLFQSVFVGGPGWPHGLPRVGTLSFIVPKVDRNILDTDIRASGSIFFYDSLDKSHPSPFNDLPVAKGAIKETSMT
jgi:hypothetical protein